MCLLIWGNASYRVKTRQARLAGVVNFTQAASRGFEELHRAIHAGETGSLASML